MITPIITSWDAEKVGAFGRKPMRFRHRAHETDLFTDDRLARLIERTPRESYYVNTMRRGATDRSSRREGEIRGLSGADVLQAVRDGHIWILLLFPDTYDASYGELLDTIYDEITGNVPGLDVHKRKISILVSSPDIPVFYHCELAGQTLWQVRGRKTVYVYPNTEPYLPRPNLERIVLNEAHEISLPYDPAWDTVAEVFTIDPGDMLHWPLNAPHRIQNASCLNVSFTTEHVTSEVRRNYAVHYGNGIIRRTLGVQRLSATTSGPSYWMKLGTMAAARALKLQKGREQTFRVDFTVDPKAPDGFRDIPAYDFRK
jgi:hypothetical protein